MPKSLIYFTLLESIATVLVAAKNRFARYSIKDFCTVPDDGSVEGTSIVTKAVVADHSSRKDVKDQLNRVQFW
jgi:hypothetical protein